MLIYTLIHCLDGFNSILKIAKNETEIIAFKLQATAEQMCQGEKTSLLTPLLEEAMSCSFE